MEESKETLDVMLRIDEIHLQYPFMGSRRITGELAEQGLTVNSKKVIRLMRVMGICAIPEKKNHHQG